LLTQVNLSRPIDYTHANFDTKRYGNILADIPLTGTWNACGVG